MRKPSRCLGEAHSGLSVTFCGVLRVHHLRENRACNASPKEVELFELRTNGGIMNNTDKRQMIDEVYFLGKSKQHSSTFIITLKGSLRFEDIEKILKDKRSAYNYQLVNIFKKYKVKHDDLYSDLDLVWNVCMNTKDSAEQLAALRRLAIASATGVRAASPGLVLAAVFMANPIAVFLGMAFGGPSMLIVQYKVRRLWKAYRRNCKLFTEQYLMAL